MGYILIEESVFRQLINRVDPQVRYDFTESDYWMNGKDTCDYLQISQALLNSYRRNNTLSYIKKQEIYYYKRADVYKLKSSMDKELLDSGSLIGECLIVNTHEDFSRFFGDGNENKIMPQE